LRGNFTVSRTNKNFSSIAINEAHEKLNTVTKGDGGAIDFKRKVIHHWICFYHFGSRDNNVAAMADLEGSHFQKQDLKQHEQALACQK